jgi:phage terminase large subunit-like protein
MSPTTAPRQATRTRKTAGRKSAVDPVTQYALDVSAGVIVAGRAVRLACQRHLNNLASERTAAFPYYFDRASAQHVIDFFPTFLTLENGEPFTLPPWLQFFYGSLFGWKCWGGDGRVTLDPEHVKRKGKRRFLYGFGETSKGSGKTPSLGGCGLYGLTFDDEPFAEIYAAGFDKGQASIQLNDAIRMADDSPDLLDEGLEVGKYNIANLRNGSFFRAVSSEHRGKSGPRPHMVLGDEIHEHRDGRVINKLTAGFKGRTQPLAVLFTNSGSDKTSICWEYHQKSLAVLEGTSPDEQWFAYICHLDPCEKCYGDGYRQPQDGCEACDDWTDPAVWPKVAPALGIVVQPKYLQDAIDMALSVPSEYSLKRRLNFCIWTETHQVWIPSDRWDACKVDAVSDGNAKMLPCALGLDPSSTLDLTALVAALRVDDPPSTAPAAEVEIEGMDEHGQQVRLAYTLNFYVELIPYFWIPKTTLLERVRTERIPYDVWERDQRLFATPGPAIDHNAVYEFTLATYKRLKAQRIGMDENSGRFLFMRLRDDGRLGDKVVSVGQGKKLSEAFKFIEILIAHRRLRHNGHPVLSWCFANAEPQRDRIGALWIEKPSETKRIDGAVASAMAIKELMALPAKRPRSIGAFVV